MGEGQPVGGAVTDPAWATHCGDRWRTHVLAETGLDICDVVGPSPRRPRDWATMMRRLGVRDMSGVISAVHGAPIPYRQAMRGDIVRRGWAIGICRGDKAEFFGGRFVSMRDVDAAWRIPPQLQAGLHSGAQPVVPAFPAHAKVNPRPSSDADDRR